MFASWGHVMEYAAAVREVRRYGEVGSMEKHDVRHRSTVRFLVHSVCPCGTPFATSWNQRCESEWERRGGIEPLCTFG